MNSIQDKLEEADRLVAEAKGLSDRYGQFVDYIGEYVSLKNSPLDRSEVIGLIESGEFANLDADKKAKAIAYLKEAVGYMDEYWASSGGGC